MAGRKQSLRIIGGDWRSRKLSFPDLDGLRPTTDRVRETLFNWLAPLIEGMHGLDLFAGSGALGLEALSRQAAHVTFVDTQAPVIQSLRENLQLLGAGERANLIQMNAIEFLKADTHQYDLVFIDPPFRKNLLQDCITQLANSTLLQQGAYIYIEHGSDETLPELPDSWHLYRSKQAGQVKYHLIKTSA